MFSWLRTALVAAGAVALAGSYAHGQSTTTTTPSPATLTATCKDGTSFSGTTKHGACGGHGGVKAWTTASAAPAAATPEPASAQADKPIKTASSSAPVNTQAAKPGGGAGQVWVNTSTKVYHCQGSKWYGKTKQGEYMPEAQAKSSGFHPSGNKACTA